MSSRTSPREKQRLYIASTDLSICKKKKGPRGLAVETLSLGLFFWENRKTARWSVLGSVSFGFD